MFVECVFYTLCYDYLGVFGPNGREMGGGGIAMLYISLRHCAVFSFTNQRLTHKQRPFTTTTKRLKRDLYPTSTTD